MNLEVQQVAQTSRSLSSGTNITSCIWAGPDVRLPDSGSYALENELLRHTAGAAPLSWVLESGTAPGIPHGGASLLVHTSKSSRLPKGKAGVQMIVSTG